ncbi:GGDEF domain-containing protein [Pendulispora albinea]|uniref:diguanylate cyclase n=1 Tax=Pendulispora albinea TaxID=2741071 RepID=A0ABZ2M309_9BACT
MTSIPPDDEEKTRVGKAPLDLVLGKSVRDRAYLIVLAGDSVGAMYRVEDGETLIGRTSTAKIRLTDDGISRRHARIVQRGTEVIIEDLQSANGTAVNDEKLEAAHILHDGDKIHIGSTTILKFTYHDDLEESFQQRMYEAALRDGLTKAFNKKHFLDRLETELAYAKRHRQPLSLIMMDVDHFKSINDTYGHVAGDFVLARLAKLAMGQVRTEDLFARYGGEEFGVICRGLDASRAGIFAERLRQLIASTPFENDDCTISVTISLGIATYPDVPAEDVGALITAADEALYAAKRSGRNRVQSALAYPPKAP